jgi:hypothetical protein
MDNLGLLLLNAGLTAFGFFVCAPILLNAISTFTVQKRFAQAMVQEGIIEEKEVRQMQPKKQLAGCIIAAIVLAAAFLVGSRINFGVICVFFGFAVGLIRYRRILQFNTLTVKRFQNTYRDSYDAKKLNRYVDKML